MHDATTRFTGTMRYAVAFAALVLASGAVAGETIFRCDAADGSVTFSDSPCDERAREYQSAASLSVVAAPQNLSERIEANRAFIDQRREQLREARAAAREESGTEPQAHRVPPPSGLAAGSGLLQLPYLPPAWEQPAPQPVREPSAREERFSALSGRQPGSVRRRSEEDDNDS